MKSNYSLVSHPAPRKCEAVTRAGPGPDPGNTICDPRDTEPRVRGQFSGPRMIN